MLVRIAWGSALKLQFLSDQFRRWCDAEGLSIEATRAIPYGEQFIFVFGQGRTLVNFYHTGRAMVQGAPSECKERIEEWVRSHAVGPAEKKAGKPSRPAPKFPDRIGIDESGKGDYFGPLVVCAAFAHAEEDGWLAELGVKDSKKMADGALIKLAAEIRPAVLHETVVITPPKYNELYARAPNLNRLLAWGHARSLETLLGRVSAGAAISDQFGDRTYLEKALMEKGRAVSLVQMPRAEVDMAVAAASVFARAEFLRRLKKMEEEYQMDFPKGASSGVEQQAREFVKRYGRERLGEVAKLHFKTTLRVVK